MPLTLLLDEEIDDRLEFVGGHVGGVFDLGEIGVFQIKRGLLASGGVIVLERDVALEFRIEQRGVGVEGTGLLRQIGEGIALQHGRNAVQLVLIADEVETGRALAEKLRNVAVLAQVGKRVVSTSSIRSLSTSGFCIPPTMLITS